MQSYQILRSSHAGLIIAIFLDWCLQLFIRFIEPKYVVYPLFLVLNLLVQTDAPDLKYGVYCYLYV